MDRNEIQDKLNGLAELERYHRGDAIRLVGFYVEEYKEKYGETPWLQDFIYNYMEARSH